MSEIENHYSLADVVDANLALDIRDASERKAYADAEAQPRGRK